MKNLKKRIVMIISAAVIASAPVPASGALLNMPDTFSQEELLSMAQSFLSKDMIKKIQTALNALGYACGEVDGIIGPKTIEAGVRFLESQGISVNGEISMDIVNRVLQLMEEKAGVKVVLPGQGTDSSSGLGNIKEMIESLKGVFAQNG